jgi:hypothetical protein
MEIYLFFSPLMLESHQMAKLENSSVKIRNIMIKLAVQLLELLQLLKQILQKLEINSLFK